MKKDSGLIGTVPFAWWVFSF